MTETKTYTINQQIYHLKNRYTLKDWGKILKILSDFKQGEDITGQVVVLLAENKLTELLNIILDRPIDLDIYEDDFEEVNKIIRDFFSRNNGLIKNTANFSET